MNKVIILGHPDSGYQSVESLLLACGVQPAIPSRREGLLPREIHQTLRRAHQIPPVGSITAEHGFLPVPIGTVWHGMAMDLLLGNLGREPWGWADPETIFFLDYWHTLDPDSIFVLVYDSPASCLRSTSPDESSAGNESEIRTRLDNWAAYNSAMLRFFFRHTNRCLLVHSRRPHVNSRLCLEEIQTRLTAPLDVTHADDTGPLPTAATGGSLAAAANDAGFPVSIVRNSDPTEVFLIERCLEHHPELRALYDELQAAANLPIDQEVDDVTSGIKAWMSWIRERNAAFRALERLDSKARENERDLSHLREQHQVSLKTLTELRDLETAANHRVRELESELQRLRADFRLSSLQVSQACEELQDRLADNRKLRIKVDRAEIARIAAARTQTARPEPTRPEADPAPVRPTGAANRVKRQLSYRLGAIMVSRAKTPVGILSLPFALVRESIRFQREKNKSPEPPLPPLRDYADAHLADKVKRQLSYRLGNTLIRRCKSPWGWIVLPFALIRQAQAFHRSRSSSQ